MGSPVSGSIHHDRKAATQLSASGLQVAPDIRSHPAGRAIATDHKEKLMRREMRQLVKTKQRDLRPLPVVDRGIKLQMREFDFAGMRPPPLAHAEMRGSAQPGIEVQRLIP
jgi:hypothetical protein